LEEALPPFFFATGDSSSSSSESISSSSSVSSSSFFDLEEGFFDELSGAGVALPVIFFYFSDFAMA
jgi:hypothetical protein